MASIAYVTNSQMIEYHRINGNRTMNFWRPSYTKKFADFNDGDYLFFLARTEDGDWIGYDLNHTDSMDGKVIYWDTMEKKVTSEWDNFAQWLEDEMAYWKEMVDYDGKKKE